MNTELKNARAKVNSYKFGTAEWEDAMQVVRDLVARANATRAPEEYRSIDGNIWN